MYSVSFSIPIPFLPNFLATAQVVPLPENGSNTKSPSLLLDKITLRNNSSGFCVEWAFLPSAFFILSLPGAKWNLPNRRHLFAAV